MSLQKILVNPNFQISLFGLICFAFIFLGVDSGKSVLMLVPFVVFAAFAVFFNPSIIVLLFLGTFYIGYPLFIREMLAVVAADIVLLVLCAAYFSRAFRNETVVIRFTGIQWSHTVFMTVFFVASAVSIVLNLHNIESKVLPGSLWYAVNIVQLAVVFLVFSNREISSLREPGITLVLLLSVFEGVLAMLQYAQMGAESITTLKSIRGTFVLHHAMLGNMMVFPLAFCFYRMTTVVNKLKKTAYLIGVIFSFYIMIISGSRSSLVGGVAAIALWLLSSFNISRKYIATLIIVGVIGAGIVVYSPIFSIVLTTLGSGQSNSLDLSSYGRLLIWKGAVDNFVQAPVLTKIFGIGIGTFYRMPYSFTLTEGIRMASGAHNNFLHVLTEIGIVGFIVFMSFFGFILVTLWKRSKNDRLCQVYFFTTLALLFSGLTQETFWFQPAFGRFWLLYTMFLGICLGNKEEAPAVELVMKPGKQ